MTSPRANPDVQGIACYLVVEDMPGVGLVPSLREKQTDREVRFELTALGQSRALQRYLAQVHSVGLHADLYRSRGFLAFILVLATVVAEDDASLTLRYDEHIGFEIK